MRKLILAAALVAIAAPAAASDQTDIAAVVKQYNAEFSPKFCAPQASIIDDFGQHFWQGATACADWLTSFAADSKANAITDGIVKPGKPWRIKVNGDRAYAVYPSKYDYKMKGKAVHETGVWTFAFQKLAEGWRITGWAWAQH
ncbi:MAG: hypothetical protein HY243_15845 [Proteobacteria bacterium]|nr:hypothetical protein [Pseudomonadota bacterium]